MEEKIVRKLYSEYLSEAFNLDPEEYQNNCYIITDQRTNKYFINPEKNTVDKYFEIGEFQCGYALVKNEKGYNYINERGELLLPEFLKSASDFHNGYALVSDGSLSNFIDTEGNYIFKSPQYMTSDSKFYPNGVGIIKSSFGEGVSVINNKGKKILSSSFYSIDSFQGKYAVATQKKRNHNPLDTDKYWIYEDHIISCYGEDIKTDYEYLKQVAEGIFVAKEKNQHFLVDVEGHKIGHLTFDSFQKKFKDGYLIIELMDSYNAIDRNGNRVFEKWYKSIDYIGDGLFKVSQTISLNAVDENGNGITRKQSNFLTSEGSLLYPEWFTQVYNFYNGMAVVKLDEYQNVYHEGMLTTKKVSSNNEYQILYRDGTLSTERFKDINEAFSFINAQKEQAEKERLASQTKKELRKVSGFGARNYEYPDGTLFFKNQDGLVSNMASGTFAHYYRGELTIYNKYGKTIATLSNMPFLYNTNTMNLKVITETPKVKKVTGTKKWFHYSYEADGKKYLLDYEPVADYGDIVICQSQNLYYVFQKATLNTIELGEKANISLEANYVRVGQKKYFISGLDFIDITDLPFEKAISKKIGIKSVKTYDEFKAMCESPEYKEKIEIEVANLKEKIEQEKQARLIEEVNQKRAAEKQMIEAKRESLRESLGSLSELLTQCSKYINDIQLLVNSNSYEKVTVPEELLLIPVADHLEINPIFLTPGILKFTDLSMISFANVKVSGLDLSYTNAQINPQEVYNKDMSNGKYCGMDFNLTSFKDVNTENSDFTGAILDFATDTETIAKGK